MHLTRDEVGFGLLIVGAGVAVATRRLEAWRVRDPRRRGWFVLRDRAFSVPARRPWWPLVGILAIDAALAGYEYLGRRVDVAVVIATFGTLFVARMCLVEYPMTLRREGIVVIRLLRRRLVPWSEARHSHLLVRVLEGPPEPVVRPWALRPRPVPPGWSPPARIGGSVSALSRETLAEVIRHYSGDAGARAAIGTGAEYDRLDRFRRHATPAPPATAPTATAPTATPATAPTP